jgi:hypothetical protein
MNRKVSEQQDEERDVVCIGIPSVWNYGMDVNTGEFTASISLICYRRVDLRNLTIDQIKTLHEMTSDLIREYHKGEYEERCQLYKRNLQRGKNELGVRQ